MLHRLMIHDTAFESQEMRRFYSSCSLMSANVQQCVRLAYVHRCISKELHPIHALMRIVLVMPEMEVVIVAIAQNEKKADKVDDGSCRGILSEVASLISAHQPLRIDIWSWTSRQFFIEAHDSLHTSCILCSTNC